MITPAGVTMSGCSRHSDVFPGSGDYPAPALARSMAASTFSGVRGRSGTRVPMALATEGAAGVMAVWEEKSS